MTHRDKKFGAAKTVLTGLFALGLTACGSDFIEGTYIDADPDYHTAYQFNKSGQGKRLADNWNDESTFTYRVSKDEVTTTHDNNTVFKRINTKTLERPDGSVFILKE